jgi:hypothetical protein
MGPKSALVHLCGLLLAAVLCVTSGGGTAAPKPMPPEQFTPEGKEALQSALERLRRTGSFNHPDYPWVVRARLVRGDTLYLVDFMRRRRDGKGFDLVGKAVEVTLAFSEEYKSWLPSGDSPPPVKRDSLLVRVQQMRLHTEDADVEAPCRIGGLELPGRLRESGFRPFAEAEARLSHDQRVALDGEDFLSPEQKTFLAAFGDKGCDLLMNVHECESRQTLVAMDEKAGEWRGNREVTFPKLAVVRLDKKGEILTQFRGTDVTVDRAEIFPLLSGDDSRGVTLKGPDGLKFILPATKPDR